MVKFLLRFFTWWNRATLSTGLWTLLRQAAVDAGLDDPGQRPFLYPHLAYWRDRAMHDTDIRTLEEKAKLKKFAPGHLKDEKGNYVNANKFHESDYTVWLGNRKGPGRISSTVRDLLKWDAALYTEKLIKQATLAEAFTGATLNNGTKINYGFGWEVLTDKAGKKYVQHTGGNPGISNLIVRYLDEKKTIIILCNNAHESMQTLVTELKG